MLARTEHGVAAGKSAGLLPCMQVWKHSKHYNSPARLVVLMREICNDLISQARNYVDADQLFQMEPTEAVERLMVTLRVCGSFKSVYFDYKSRASSEVPNNPWRIQNTVCIHTPAVAVTSKLFHLPLHLLTLACNCVQPSTLGALPAVGLVPRALP